MKKLRSYLAAASVRLGLPMDIAAGLPHLEVNGFRECSVDRHTGILEYNRERIVIGLNIGSLTVVGSGLEIRQMHRERLTIIGQIDCLTYGSGFFSACLGCPSREQARNGVCSGWQRRASHSISAQNRTTLPPRSGSCDGTRRARRSSCAWAGATVRS